MSQTATAPPPPQRKPQPQTGPPAGAAGALGPGSASGAPGTQAQAAGTINEARGIPASLSRRRSLTAIALLLCTLLTAAQLALSWNALKTAGADAQQLIRVQGVKVDLLRADALATNAFLVGGLEPPEQRAAYDEALTAATAGISEAAKAQGVDQAALAELSQIVVRYAANMEVARSNNRQGLPVGAAYLRAASNELRGRGMVVVDALVDANQARAETSIADQHPLLIALPCVLTLALLFVVNRWIAQRFKRRFNTGLVAAAAIVLGMLVTATSLSAVQSIENGVLRDGRYTDLVDGAAARSAANAAKSNESLRLIARGSGKSFEDAWVAQSKAVVADVSDSRYDQLKTEWSAYAAAHDAIVAKDEAGDWDGAVALATSRDEGAASALFERFDETVASFVAGSASDVESSLSRRMSWFLVLAGTTLLAGLGAIALAWRGISRRLEEFA